MRSSFFEHGRRSPLGARSTRDKHKAIIGRFATHGKSK
jgi:hypothetical protein